MVDANQAREYMDSPEGPGKILGLLVEALAKDQPGPSRKDVLSYMKSFIEEMLAEEDAAAQEEKDTPGVEAPPCWLTGLPSEFKVRFPPKGDAAEGEVRFYTEDSFSALKRKGKLRGCEWCLISEDFPAIEELPEVTYFTSEEEARKFRAEMEERPVTPPKKGFKMTGPGQNTHNEYVGPSADAPSFVKFEARALGGSETSSSAITEEERKAKIAEAAGKRSENAVMPDASSAQLGCDRLLGASKLRELNEKQRKNELLGKIRAHYERVGECEPFGLAAADIGVIEAHYEKCQGEISGHLVQAEKQRAAASKAARVVKASQPASEEHHGGRRTLDFAPRALGGDGYATATGDRDQSAPPTNSQPLSKEEMRRRRAEAAAKRFAK